MILSNLAKIEPPPNFGVFNKGRASAKIKVDESKRTKQRGMLIIVFEPSIPRLTVTAVTRLSLSHFL